LNIYTSTLAQIRENKNYFLLIKKVMLYLASDHAGFELKQDIAAFLKQTNIEFIDLGPFSYDQLDDYPDFIIPAAEKVAAKPEKNRAIILGASGQGEAMTANKVKGIRAAVFYGGPEAIITLSKIHNNANILSLGAKFMDKEKAQKIIKLWLNTNFTNQARHLRRINKIANYENQI